MSAFTAKCTASSLVYASWQGAKITEIPVTHHAREFGSSKYGLERVFKVLLDILVVKFLSRYLTKPIYVFGGFWPSAAFFPFLHYLAWALCCLKFLAAQALSRRRCPVFGHLLSARLHVHPDGPSGGSNEQDIF